MGSGSSGLSKQDTAPDIIRAIVKATDKSEYLRPLCVRLEKDTKLCRELQDAVFDWPDILGPEGVQNMPLARVLAYANKSRRLDHKMACLDFVDVMMTGYPDKRRASEVLTECLIQDCIADCLSLRTDELGLHPATIDTWGDPDQKIKSDKILDFLLKLLQQLSGLPVFCWAFVKTGGPEVLTQMLIYMQENRGLLLILFELFQGDQIRLGARKRHLDVLEMAIGSEDSYARHAAAGILHGFLDQHNELWDTNMANLIESGLLDTLSRNLRDVCHKAKGKFKNNELGDQEYGLTTLVASATAPIVPMKKIPKPKPGDTGYGPLREIETFSPMTMQRIGLDPLAYVPHLLYCARRCATHLPEGYTLPGDLILGIVCLMDEAPVQDYDTEGPQLKLLSTQVLHHMSSHPDLCEVLVANGLCHATLTALASGHESLKVLCTKILKNLSMHCFNVKFEVMLDPLFGSLINSLSEASHDVAMHVVDAMECMLPATDKADIPYLVNLAVTTTVIPVLCNLMMRDLSRLWDARELKVQPLHCEEMLYKLVPLLARLGLSGYAEEVTAGLIRCPQVADALVVEGPHPEDDPDFDRVANIRFAYADFMESEDAILELDEAMSMAPGVTTARSGAMSYYGTSSGYGTARTTGMYSESGVYAGPHPRTMAAPKSSNRAGHRHHMSARHPKDTWDPYTARSHMGQDPMAALETARSAMWTRTVTDGMSTFRSMMSSEVGPTPRLGVQDYSGITPRLGTYHTNADGTLTQRSQALNDTMRSYQDPMGASHPPPSVRNPTSVRFGEADVEMTDVEDAPKALSPPSIANPDITLTLTILRATGLQNRDEIGKSDPYLQVFWETTGAPQPIAQTSTAPNTLNPVWNEAFQVKVPERDRLVFQIWDDDRASADFLGECIADLRNGETSLELQPREGSHEDAAFFATCNEDFGSLYIKMEGLPAVFQERPGSVHSGVSVSDVTFMYEERREEESEYSRAMREAEMEHRRAIDSAGDTIVEDYDEGDKMLEEEIALLVDDEDLARAYLIEQTDIIWTTLEGEFLSEVRKLRALASISSPTKQEEDPELRELTHPVVSPTFMLEEYDDDEDVMAVRAKVDERVATWREEQEERMRMEEEAMASARSSKPFQRAKAIHSVAARSSFTPRSDAAFLGMLETSESKARLQILQGEADTRAGLEGIANKNKLLAMSRGGGYMTRHPNSPKASPRADLVPSAAAPPPQVLPVEEAREVIPETPRAKLLRKLGHTYDDFYVRMARLLNKKAPPKWTCIGNQMAIAMLPEVLSTIHTVTLTARQSHLVAALPQCYLHTCVLQLIMGHHVDALNTAYQAVFALLALPATRASQLVEFLQGAGPMDSLGFTPAAPRHPNPEGLFLLLDAVTLMRGHLEDDSVDVLQKVGAEVAVILHTVALAQHSNGSDSKSFKSATQASEQYVGTQHALTHSLRDAHSIIESHPNPSEPLFGTNTSLKRGGPKYSQPLPGSMGEDATSPLPSTRSQRVTPARFQAMLSGNMKKYMVGQE